MNQTKIQYRNVLYPAVINGKMRFAFIERVIVGGPESNYYEKLAEPKVGGASKWAIKGEKDFWSPFWLCSNYRT